MHGFKQCSIINSAKLSVWCRTIYIVQSANLTVQQRTTDYDQLTLEYCEKYWTNECQSIWHTVEFIEQSGIEHINCRRKERPSVALRLWGNCSESLGPYASVLDQELIEGVGGIFQSAPQFLKHPSFHLTDSKKCGFTPVTSVCWACLSLRPTNCHPSTP